MRTRFARVDVWVRDIRQVVEDAIAKAQPESGKVTLIGYSAGAARIGRALYDSDAFEHIVGQDRDFVQDKTDRVVFIAPLLRGPDEEAGPFVTFPLNLSRRDINGRWDMIPERHAVCTGHTIPGTQEEQWEQIMAHDFIGSGWGNTPGGRNRAPTFSTYGFNPTTAAKIPYPTLVLQGRDDTLAPAADTRRFYVGLPNDNKILVELDCASHSMLVEGCSGERCAHSGKAAYGAHGNDPWAGPHSTIQAALAEWIKHGKFAHKRSGEFLVDSTGSVEPLSLDVDAPDGGQ